MNNYYIYIYIYIYIILLMISVPCTQGNTFSRVSSSHGQTLLSLAFNYGILSLKTLTIGTDQTLVALEERPANCLQNAAEDEKLNLVIELLMKDFKTGPGSNVSVGLAYIPRNEVSRDLLFYIHYSRQPFQCMSYQLQSVYTSKELFIRTLVGLNMATIYIYLKKYANDF